MLQRRRIETRSLYRSVRYRINRDDQIRTAEQSACTFRIKRNSCMDATKTTLAQTIQTGRLSPKYLTLQTEKMQTKGIIKIDYLKSFNSMMERGEKITFGDQPYRTLNSLDDEFRVALPDFQQKQKQVEFSEHSLLTPIATPINHIKLMIKNVQIELKPIKIQVLQIKSDLNSLKGKHIENLTEIENYANDQFQKIRALLRKNQISQQQKKLKIKRQLNTLNEQHDSNRKLFQKIDERSTNMQLQIFNSTPFNLTVTKQQEEVYI